MPRAKLRTPALRDQILEVAVATLATHGVAGFTARRIAADASTSVPAVYELFGDKAGLVREVFFEGFRRLGREYEALASTDDPRADLVAVALTFRRFALANPLLVEVMFSRPFADFDPTPDDLRSGAKTRLFVVGRVQRAIDAGLLAGDATDIAHVLLALVHGLVAQETAGWMSRSRAARDRRWHLALAAVLDGLRPTS